MINLLPPDYKQTVIYARRNATLRKWILALFVGIFGVILIIGGGYIYMEQSIKNAQKEVAASQRALEEQDIEGTRKRLDEISANTKLILQVLSREILFSGLLRQLGASLPPGTAMEQIKIDKVSGGITLRAVASDINSATQIQLNLQDPNNKIFQKADIETINCGAAETGTQTTYPCTVQIRALFAKDNPYVYLQSSTGAQQ